MLIVSFFFVGISSSKLDSMLFNWKIKVVIISYYISSYYLAIC